MTDTPRAADIPAHALHIDVQRRDWQKIIGEIKAAHALRYGRRLSNYKLGEMVGVDHSQIEWMEAHANAEPRYYTGARLLLVLASYGLRDVSLKATTDSV